MSVPTDEAGRDKGAPVVSHTGSCSVGHSTRRHAEVIASSPTSNRFGRAVIRARHSSVDTPSTEGGGVTVPSWTAVLVWCVRMSASLPAVYDFGGIAVWIP